MSGYVHELRHGIPHIFLLEEEESTFSERQANEVGPQISNEQGTRVY